MQEFDKNMNIPTFGNYPERANKSSEKKIDAYQTLDAVVPNSNP